MKNLSNDTETEETKNAPEKIDWDTIGTNSVDTLSNDLSVYQTVENTEENLQPETVTNSEPENIDTSDKRYYYQTGKKAGQRRPKPLGGVTTTMGTPKDTSISGDIIDGALLLMLIDMLIPALVVGVNNKFSKKKISGEKMGLTESQQKKFEPIFNAIVKAIQVKGNPVLIGTIGLACVYLVNYFTARMDND